MTTANKTSALYFFTRSSVNLESGQCDCDCDCACAPHISGEVSQHSLPQASTLLFPADGIQFYKLDNGDFMAIGEKSPLSVMSSACFDLFKTFPAQVGHVVQQMEYQWDDRAINDIIGDMFQNGLLVDGHIKDLSYSESPGILSAWVHLTSRCNLSCRYCYVNNLPEELSPEVGKGIVDSVLRSAVLHNYATIKLKYAGGEPLLNFPALIENFCYAKAQCANAGIALEGKIISNGTLLRREIIQKIKSHGLSLTISLDGLQPYHDSNRPLHNGKSSFAHVKQGILLALEHGLKPGISITISNSSAAGLPELVDWLLDLDLQFTFNFYRENERSQHQRELSFDNQRILDALFKAYHLIEKRAPDFKFWNALGDRVNLQHSHDKPCSVGKDYVVFDVHGNLAGCQMDMETTLGDYHSPDPLAVIRESSIAPKNSPVSGKLDCVNCELKFLCSGGCPVLAKQVAGSYFAKSPYCEIYKEIIPVLLNLEARSLVSGRVDP